MILDDIAHDQVPQSPFSAETLEKIEQSVIVDISERPVNTGGAYGDLFSGYHTVLGLKVAMKRPREVLRRSFREGHTWMIFRDIQHPNILPFLGIYEHDGYHHLVSPFMENGTLDVYLAEHPDADRANLLRQAAGGLAHMHDLKIVHGDIKANNILVTSHGRVFVCDFGLSQIVELRSVDGAYSITSLGNLHWASPELIEPEEDDCVDIPRTFQSDVWAFGMTIYQVLSGRLPYSGKREYTIIKSILGGSLPEQDPRLSLSGIPYDFIWEVSSQCLRKHPSERISMLEAAICLGDNYDREVSSFEKTVQLERMLIADHPKHGVVVLKRFRRAPKVRKNGLPRSDFQVELWASLQHPNILPFIGVCVVGTGHRPFLMSAYMDQGTIQDYVAAHPEKSRTELLCQAAQGLLYLHEELIVHGEVRAENLLMSGAGRVLLSGFGSSALVGGPTAIVTGTPTQLARWDSPEVLKGGSKTFSSDIYAFGMTIYEVLSGQIPFADLSTDEEVATAVLRDDSRPPYWGDTILLERYKDTWTVVGKCWIPERNYRPLLPEVIHELKKADPTSSPTINASDQKIVNTLEEMTLSSDRHVTTQISQGHISLDGHEQCQSKEFSKETSRAWGSLTDDDPIPHLQNGSPFLRCPYEVLVKILAILSGADLTTILLTCRFLRYLVRDSTILLYHVELFRAGYVDLIIGSGLIPVADRLDALRQQEDRWNTLRWRHSEMVVVLNSGFWDLKDGAYLQRIPNAGGFSLDLWQFPSLWKGRAELTEFHDHIGISRLLGSKTDIPQDLLVISEAPELVAMLSEEGGQMPRVASHIHSPLQRMKVRMHVRSLSENSKHPLAEVETFDCKFEIPARVRLSGSFLPLRISGDKISITIASDEGPANVIICRWTDGVQLLNIKTFTTRTEFLSETSFITTGLDSDDDTVLNVYELPSDVLQAGSTAICDNPQPTFIFKLPHLKGGDRLPRDPISCTAPQPGGRETCVLPLPALSGPFAPLSGTFGLRTNPEQRIITYNWSSIVLVVHASTLIDHCKSRAEESTNIIAWHEWSHRARWLQDTTDGGFQTFGQKYVRSIRRYDSQLGEYSNFIQVLDFNPHAILRERLRVNLELDGKRPGGNDDDELGSSFPGPPGPRLITGTLDFEKEIFDEVSRSSLQYLETTSTDTLDEDGEVVMTEEHIVIKMGDTLKVLSF